MNPCKVSAAVNTKHGHVKPIAMPALLQNKKQAYEIKSGSLGCPGLKSESMPTQCGGTIWHNGTRPALPR